MKNFVLPPKGILLTIEPISSPVSLGTVCCISVVFDVGIVVGGFGFDGKIRPCSSKAESEGLLSLKKDFFFEGNNMGETLTCLLYLSFLVFLIRL